MKSTNTIGPKHETWGIPNYGRRRRIQGSAAGFLGYNASHAACRDWS